MSFLRNAKKFAKDAGELNDSLKKMGINTRLGQGGKDKDAASTYSTQSSAPTESSTDTRSTPIYTPTTPAASSINAPAGDGTGPSVPVNTAEWAHTGKLPMTARKSIRDKWETNKAEREQELSKILGVPWYIFVDYAGVYSYASEGSYAQRNMGDAVDEYMRSAIKHLGLFVSDYGEGKNEINSLAHNHVLTLEPTFDASIRYVSAGVADGRLIVLFKNDKLSVNIGDAMDNIAEVLNKAGAQASSGGASGGGAAMNMHARQSIQKDYTDKIDEQLELARSYLQEPSLQFDPNFEANFAQLVAYEQSLDPDDVSDKRDPLIRDWNQRFGRDTFDYFKGFVNTLKNNRFNKDDMLQEGFNESVDRHIVKLVVQEKTKKRYNEAGIEDGVLVMRAPPAYWATNIADACEDLIDLL